MLTRIWAYITLMFNGYCPFHLTKKDQDWRGRYVCFKCRAERNQIARNRRAVAEGKKQAKVDVALGVLKSHRDMGNMKANDSSL